MLLEDDLPGLLGELSAGVSPRADFVAGARRRHRRRQLGRGASAVAVLALLATGTTAVLTRGSTSPGVLRPVASPSADVPPPVAARDAYASVEQGTHDLILISADTGVHTVLHHTAPGDPVPATAVVSPSRRYVYYLTDPGDGHTTTAWRIPIDGGAPHQLPSSAHAGPGGVGGVGISPSDLVVSPDDTEYAYPSFDQPFATYVQQTRGGPAELIPNDPSDLAGEIPLGWLDDGRMVQLASGVAAKAGLFIVVQRVSGGGRLGDVTTVVNTMPGSQLSGIGALLAGHQTVVSDPLSSRGTRLRVLPAGDLSDPEQSPDSLTWTTPAVLDGFDVVDITPLPDGRALVRYDNGHCGGKPLPTLIFSPDGSSEPAYGAPASALHC